jgi:hypothetical protein
MSSPSASGSQISCTASTLGARVEADWVDGPRLATWLRSHPDFHPGDLSLTSRHALVRWEAGVAAGQTLASDAATGLCRRQPAALLCPLQSRSALARANRVRTVQTLAVTSTTVQTWAAAFAAIGTVGTLLVLAVAHLWERRARRKQERRRQAERIAAWTSAEPPAEGETKPVTLSNPSEAPVYGVVASLVFIEGAGPGTGRELLEAADQQESAELYDAFAKMQRHLYVLPPGRSEVALPGGWGGMSKRAGVEVAFTHSARGPLVALSGRIA